MTTWLHLAASRRKSTRRGKLKINLRKSSPVRHSLRPLRPLVLVEVHASAIQGYTAVVSNGGRGGEEGPGGGKSETATGGEDGRGREMGG